MAPRSSTQTAGSPPTRSLEFERECVLFFEEVVQIFGISKSVGQIYGLLYASPLPLSFSDIVEKLEISKGSASQGLHLLRSLGAINIAAQLDGESSLSKTKSQIAARASRSITYRPELSLRKLVSGVLRERLSPLAANSTDRLVHLRELAAQKVDGTSFYLNRARQLNTWRRRLKSVIPLLNALLVPATSKCEY